MVEKGKTNYMAILLVGALSMFFAEVFAGSSQIWLIDPWSLLVTFPLYLFHLLFFFNLATRTNRTSVPQLYLWGVMFALYEAWITKVLWSGYPGSDGPIFGLVGGIAILEFNVLVFFWHPILAFVLPILVFELLTQAKNDGIVSEEIIFLNHLQDLEKNSFIMKIFIILIFFTSAFIAVSTGFNPFITVIASLSSIGIIFLFYKLSNSLSINDLKLGKKGFSIVLIYIILLNTLMFVILAPHLIPQTFLPFLIIIGFYVGVGIILKFSPPVDIRALSVPETTESLMNSSKILKLLMIYTALTMFYCFLGFLSYILFAIFMFGLFIFGPIFFIYFAVKAIKG